MHSPLLVLVKLLREDFPKYQFREDTLFRWKPDGKLIYYDAGDLHAQWLLLHELGHAELGHKSFNFDIELLRLEAQAWTYAKDILGPHYSFHIEEDFIQDNLDTYRTWLYKRSNCPGCMQTGIQRSKNTYSCLNCRYSWRVNDARQCQLRRYSSGS